MSELITSDLGYGDYPYTTGPLPYDPSTSTLAGIDKTTLQQWLAQSQLALFQLAAGMKVVEAKYTQGDGEKSVRYTAANMGMLNGFIQTLQCQLGIVPRARRPISMVYR